MTPLSPQSEGGGPPRRRRRRGDPCRLKALALISLGLALSACSEQPGALRSAPIAGDAAAVRALAGRWYDESVLRVQVIPGERGRLHVWLPAGFSIARARAVGGEIHFDRVGNGEASPLALRLLEADRAVLLPPGSEPSWCGTCTPYLARRRWPAAVYTARDAVRYFAEAAYDRAMDLLIELV